MHTQTTALNSNNVHAAAGQPVWAVRQQGRNVKRSPVRILPEQMRTMSGDTLVVEFGQRMMVELLGYGQRLWGEVVAVRRGKFIALHIPDLFKYKKDVVNESMVAVRGMVAGSSMYGFRTAIMGIMEYPEQLLFLTFPAKYESLNLRKEERVGCFISAALVFGGEEHAGAVVNLSQGGAMVSVTLVEGAPLAGVQKDEQIFIVFTLQENGYTACVRCIVRSVENSSGVIRLGLQFKTFVGQSASAVQEYVMEAKQYAAA